MTFFAKSAILDYEQGYEHVFEQWTKNDTNNLSYHCDSSKKRKKCDFSECN